MLFSRVEMVRQEGVRAIMKTETRIVEIRLAEDETREAIGRIQGVILTYGERAIRQGRTICSGSVSWPEGGIVLNEQHNRQAPITRVVPEVRGTRS